MSKAKELLKSMGVNEEESLVPYLRKVNDHLLQAIEETKKILKIPNQEVDDQELKLMKLIKDRIEELDGLVKDGMADWWP